MKWNLIHLLLSFYLLQPSFAGIFYIRRKLDKDENPNKRLLKCLPIHDCDILYGTKPSHFSIYGFVSYHQFECLPEEGNALCVASNNPQGTQTLPCLPKAKCATLWGTHINHFSAYGHQPLCDFKRHVRCVLSKEEKLTQTAQPPSLENTRPLEDFDGTLYNSSFPMDSPGGSSVNNTVSIATMTENQSSSSINASSVSNSSTTTESSLSYETSSFNNTSLPTTESSVPTETSQLSNTSSITTESSVPTDTSPFNNTYSSATESYLSTETSSFNYTSSPTIENSVPIETSPLSNYSSPTTESSVPTETSSFNNTFSPTTDSSIPTETSSLNNTFSPTTDSYLPNETSMFDNTSSPTTQSHSSLSTEAPSTPSSQAGIINISTENLINSTTANITIHRTPRLGSLSPLHN